MAGGGYQGLQEHGMILDFSVDKQSYNQATTALKNVNELLNNIAKVAAGAFAEAGLSVSGFNKLVGKLPGTIGEAGVAFAGLTAAVAGGAIAMLDNLGGTEIQMEKLSRTLWTSQAQAMAFSASLKVLGANLQDLYLSPTLMAQYDKLHSMALQMTLPSGYASQMQTVQNLSLQLKEFKLEAYYAFQWVGFYFAKYMAGPLLQLTNIMSGVNGSIVKNMPTWTRQVAAVMVAFSTAGGQIWDTLDGVYKYLVKLSNYLPGWAKGIAAALLILDLSNPFMLIVEGIALAILAFNDLQVYLEGGKSALSGLWSWLEKASDGWKIFNQIGEAAKGILSGVFRLVGNVANTFASLFGVFKGGSAMGAVKAVLVVVRDLLQGMSAVIGWIADLAKIKPLMVFLLTAMAGFGAWKAVIMGIQVATKAWAVVQGVLNAVMDANPVSIIILAVAALAAGIYELITHFSAVKKAVESAFSYLAKHIGLALLALGPFGVAILELVTHFSAVKKAVMGAFGSIGKFFASLWTGITKGFDGVVNDAIAGLNVVIHGIDHIPGIHIPSIQTIGGAAAAAAGGASASTAHAAAQRAATPSPFFLSPATMAALGSTTNNSASKTVVVHGEQTVHVHGTSPEATAAAVGRGYNRHLHNLRGAIG